MTDPLFLESDRPLKKIINLIMESVRPMKSNTLFVENDRLLNDLVGVSIYLLIRLKILRVPSY